MINIYTAVAQSPWLAWIVGIGLAAGALTAVIKFVPPAWRTLTRFTTTIDSLSDLPQFMIETRATLKAQDDGAIARDKKIEEIHHEVNYNNGSSVKDAISRVEDGVAGLYRRADTTDQNASELRDDLENTKPVIRKRKPPLH